MLKIKTVLVAFFSVLLIGALLLGTVPAQAQTQPPNVTPIPEGLSADDWAQINALLPESAPYSQQAYLKASNTGKDDHFGSAIAVSGDTVVVGAAWEDSNATGVNGDQSNNLVPYSGAAYVFVRNGNTWSQQAYLKASNTEGQDLFGTSVAIYGNTIVVGAPGEDSAATGVNGNQADNSASGGWFSAGAAYVFTRTGSMWSQQAYLKQSNTQAGDAFGVSVAISADTIAVGAPYEDSTARGLNGNQNNNGAIDSGAAYIFTRNNGVWSQQVYVKSSPEHETSDEWYDNFGEAMAMAGDTLVVGEPGSFIYFDDGNASTCGSAYVFVRVNNVWSEQARLWQEMGCGWDEIFGSSVAISGNTIVIGAPNEDSNAKGVNGNQDDDSLWNAGAAYVFVRSGTTWQKQAYLKASNTDVGDRFGAAVALFGDRVVVGAPNEDSAAVGLNGEQSINGAFDSGAVYIFARIGTTWSQHAYLKASNTNKDDLFGDRVAISSNNMILVGAPSESSNAVGVNGSQGNNLASKSGAVYAVVTSSLPKVVYSTRVGASPSTEASVDFNVAFSTAVTGVDASDFVAATSGSISGAMVTNVSGGPATYTVTVSTGSGRGTIRLNVYDDDSILDSKNIPLGGVGITNGNFYLGETYVMRPLTRMFRSQAAQDGWILESDGASGLGDHINNTNSTFIVGGDKLDRDYRSILHFSTGDLPDTAVVTRVILKIKKHSQVGEYPRDMCVDLSTPRFGTSMNLQSNDFEAAPSNSSIVGVLDPIAPGNVYRSIFYASSTTDINLTGPTQLRLRVFVPGPNYNHDAYRRFYSGDALTAADRPTLVVEYYVP